MKTSESIKELAKALATAQGQIEGAKKDTANTFFKSKYADLASVVEAIRDAFSTNGLSYVQTPCTNDKEEVGVETLLMHDSGEWIAGEPFFVPVSKQDAQGFGSALTYTRRYALAALAGVAQVDDDGNAAAKTVAERITSGKPITGKQVSVDAFDALAPEQQQFCRDAAMAVMEIFADKGDMYGFVERQHYDTEEKLAIWHLLPSDLRREFNRQKDAALKLSVRIPEQA